MKILEILTQKRITGNKGEALAVKFLKREHYKIIKTNYLGNGHEIDIIAENKDALVFVEVKTRNSHTVGLREPRPSVSVTPEKQRSIISASKGFIFSYRTKKKIRFDVIEVLLSENGGYEICHIQSAFNLNTAYKK